MMMSGLCEHWLSNITSSGFCRWTSQRSGERWWLPDKCIAWSAFTVVSVKEKRGQSWTREFQLRKRRTRVFCWDERVVNITILFYDTPSEQRYIIGVDWRLRRVIIRSDKMGWCWLGLQLQQKKRCDGDLTEMLLSKPENSSMQVN